MPLVLHNASHLPYTNQRKDLSPRGDEEYRHLFLLTNITIRANGQYYLQLLQAIFQKVQELSYLMTCIPSTRTFTCT